MPEHEQSKGGSFADQTPETKWLERWGIDWKEYLREVELGVEGPNHLLFDSFTEKILAEEWLMDYAIKEYEKGRGLTVNEFLRMLVDFETRC